MRGPIGRLRLTRAVQASTVNEFSHELSPAFSFARDVYPVGITVYPNRDLLVTFHCYQAFPYHVGVARIDSDGQPVWFRARTSAITGRSCWMTAPVWCRGLLLADEDISFEIAGWPVTVDCGYDRPYLDTVTVIDGWGRLLKRVNLVDILLKSPFAPLLRRTLNPCDPLHLNYVVRLGPDAGRNLGHGSGRPRWYRSATWMRSPFLTARRSASSGWSGGRFLSAARGHASGRLDLSVVRQPRQRRDERPVTAAQNRPRYRTRDHGLSQRRDARISARSVYRRFRQNRPLTGPPTGDSRLQPGQELLWRSGLPMARC